jgi:hypothetical protein
MAFNISGDKPSSENNFGVMNNNWRVVPSCRFVESEFIDIAAAVEADFGSEEFLEDYAFG